MKHAIKYFKIHLSVMTPDGKVGHVSYVTNCTSFVSYVTIKLPQSFLLNAEMEFKMMFSLCSRANDVIFFILFLKKNSLLNVSYVT